MENIALSRTELDATLDAQLLAQNILSHVMRFRRTNQTHVYCETTCPLCQTPHFSKVVFAIQMSKPITFVLPAFPGKSPNLAKVLGPLPDMAERLALQFLQELCEQIQQIYAPGAKIILCSDGRVFSDVIGMRESDVTDYQKEIDKIISELGLKNISTFHLDELFEDRSADFTLMRHKLMSDFGTSLEGLKENISLPMYLGITRFLVEDATFPGQTKSRTAIQKESKIKAYEVIRRSNAWSALISEKFPEAVRLSIHPQNCGSEKLGIRLIGAESWMTPWHGAAVLTNEGFILLKRSDAEALGAELVFSADGRPSHFALGETKNEI